MRNNYAIAYCCSHNFTFPRKKEKEYTFKLVSEILHVQTFFIGMLHVQTSFRDTACASSNNAAKALFSSENFSVLSIVAFSFLFDKYYPKMINSTTIMQQKALFSDLLYLKKQTTLS